MNADYQDFKYKELAAKLEVKRKAFDNLRKQSPARYASSGTRKRAGLWISARPPRPETGTGSGGATAIHKGLPYVGQGFIPCFWSGPGRNFLAIWQAGLRPNLKKKKIFYKQGF